MSKAKKFGVVCGLLLAILSFTQSARAQSTILNIPSTDVMPPKGLYIEADFIAHPAAFEDGGYVWYGPSAVYGVRKNLEVGVNAYFVKDAGPAKPFEIQPNFKWQFYNDEGKGLAVAAGGMLFLPLTHREESAAAGLLYMVASKKVNRARGARFTIGAYGLLGHREETKTKGGVLLGYEQPLNSRVTFMADWYSGRNQVGYAAAGFGLTLTKRSMLFASYNFGNEGRGNNWLGVYYGFAF